MKTNIPIFRAKKIGSDEYIIGQYLAYKGYSAIFNEYGLDGIDIDDTTLSIHFPDMLDSQGNKIFASLQEDGKGGDILFDMEYEFTLIFDGLKFRLDGLECNTKISEYDKFTDFDNIGIQQ